MFIGFSPLRGIPGFAHASAGRAAVANLASGLAIERSRHGIRTVCVAPGPIRTEALEQTTPTRSPRGRAPCRWDGSVARRRSPA